LKKISLSNLPGITRGRLDTITVFSDFLELAATPMYIFGNWVWKCPIGFIDAKNADDEMLKRMTDPLYNAIRHSME